MYVETPMKEVLPKDLGKGSDFTGMGGVRKRHYCV